jgi:hypothetical protein
MAHGSNAGETGTRGLKERHPRQSAPQFLRLTRRTAGQERPEHAQRPAPIADAYVRGMASPSTWHYDCVHVPRRTEAPMCVAVDPLTPQRRLRAARPLPSLPRGGVPEAVPNQCDSSAADVQPGTPPHLRPALVIGGAGASPLSPNDPGGLRGLSSTNSDLENECVDEKRANTWPPPTNTPCPVGRSVNFDPPHSRE